jgi:hypothetical protein
MRVNASDIIEVVRYITVEESDCSWYHSRDITMKVTLLDISRKYLGMCTLYHSMGISVRGCPVDGPPVGGIPPMYAAGYPHTPRSSGRDTLLPPPRTPWRS